MNSEAIRNTLDAVWNISETERPLIVKPAVGKELARMQQDLLELAGNGVRIPQVPADYLEFLEIANGFAWNGFEFFGTYQVTVKKSGYTLIDLVNFNGKMRQRKMGMDDLLVLGRFDDDIYVYNAGTKQYQTLDSLTLTEIDTWDGFDELFVASVTPYIDPDEDPDDEYPPDDEQPGIDAYD
ncbi:MAG: YrhA family protein [Lachnospiraceae bacterium]|nr:YrhA family protein [Lachnospiraceae bacterium]